MSDNITLNPGAGGLVTRAANRLAGGIFTQIVQLDFGGANTNAESLVSAGNGLPTRDSVVAPTAFNSSTLTGGSLSTTAQNIFSAQAAGANYKIRNTSTGNQTIEISNSATAVLGSSPVIIYPGDIWIEPARVSTAPSAIASAAGATFVGEWW